MYKDILFFPNLNALRFFAALLVIFHHGETIRAKNNFISYDNISFFLNGGSAVKFFFVLSGFLITYLLLKEKKKTNTIHIPSFYFRRIIRIWPLYFLLTAIGIVLFPFLFSIMKIDYDFPYSLQQSWLLFLLFLPSLVTFKYGSHLLEPLWSIGVEEWFYLIWAPLFKIFKKPLIFIVGVLILKLALILGVQLGWLQNPLATHLIKTYAFESMAIGGLGAYFLFHTRLNLTQLYKKYNWLNLILLGLVVVYIFFNNSFDSFIHIPLFSSWPFYWVFLNILFLNTIIYCAVVLPANSWLNNKWLNQGGVISYGIYMYHMLVIFTVIHFFKKHLLTLPPAAAMFAFYTLVIGGTIIVSYLSKKYFEDYFLRFRNKLTKENIPKV